MEIIVAKQADLRANIKKYFNMACNGRAVIVPRKANQNVVILSEEEFHALEKAKRNAEYLTKIELSNEQIRTGNVVVKTIEELEAIAK